MLFSSLEFLYLFLPATLLFYFVLPWGAKNYVLLMASLVFYGIAEPSCLPLLLAVSIADYGFGLAIFGQMVRGKERRADVLTAVAVILNVGVLFAFKYLDPIIGVFGGEPLGIRLPTGISFYTFQAMSYVCDVRRRASEAQRNPFLFVTYVSLFPQLVAGPIVRYSEISDSLTKRRHSINRCADGIRLFSVGLAKKVLLANGAGECWERMARYSTYCGTVVGAWLGILFFAFQIYFDFSGYSDMARGLGKIFGFEFPENFRYPYTSKSITEFWRRWHITLSSWFREYVYIPLGGNRRGRGRMYFNLLITWLLTGIWHGAGLGFLAWGLYFFLLLTVEKAFLLRYLEKCPTALRHAYALFFILVGWLIFESGGTLAYGETVEFFGQMLGIGCPLWSSDVRFELLRNLPFLCVMAVGSTSLPSRLCKRLSERYPKVHVSAVSIGAVMLLLLCTCYIAASGYNPFLYFRF